MSHKEVQEATFKFDRPTKPGFKAGPPQYVSEDIPIEQQGDTICFDIAGEWTDNEKMCAAKIVKNDKLVRYFVKWCMEGPDKGHVLNPYSIYYRAGDDVKKESRRGGHRYEFKSITQSAFDNYLKFLKTKLYVFCQTAEREVLNG